MKSFTKHLEAAQNKVQTTEALNQNPSEEEREVKELLSKYSGENQGHEFMKKFLDELWLKDWNSNAVAGFNTIQKEFYKNKNTYTVALPYVDSALPKGPELYDFAGYKKLITDEENPLSEFTPKEKELYEEIVNDFLNNQEDAKRRERLLKALATEVYKNRSKDFVVDNGEVSGSKIEWLKSYRWEPRGLLELKLK